MELYMCELSVQYNIFGLKLQRSKSELPVLVDNANLLSHPPIVQCILLFIIKGRSGHVEGSIITIYF